MIFIDLKATQYGTVEFSESEFEQWKEVMEDDSLTPLDYAKHLDENGDVYFYGRVVEEDV